MFVQPVVPTYRVPFFRRLVRLPQYAIEIRASLAMPNRAVRTCASAKHLPVVLHPVWGVMGLYWQAGLRLPSNFVRGDVLVLCGGLQQLSNYPLWLMARRRGAGVVWWGQGWTWGTSRWKAVVKRGVAAWADSVVLYTEKEAEWYRRSGFPKAVFGANNTLDDELIREATAKWPSARLGEFCRSNGLQNKEVILFSGRLLGKPQFRVLIQALVRLSSQGRDCLLAVIGDGANRAEYARFADSLGVSRNVRWLGPIYEESELAPWFLSAHCLAYPAPIGLSLIHAFNYGLPVITHDRLECHGPEIAALRPGQNGLLFRASDAGDLATKIEYLMSNQDFRAQMSSCALHTARTEFSMAHMVEQMVTAIDAATRAALQERKTRQFPGGLLMDSPTGKPVSRLPGSALGTLLDRNLPLAHGPLSASWRIESGACGSFRLFLQ